MTLIEHESEESDINSEVAIPQSYALYLAVAGKHEDVMIILLSKFNDSINIQLLDVNIYFFYKIFSLD